MDKKPTDSEIVKGLEDAVICVGRAPFVEKQRKGEQLKSDVLDLINRLQTIAEKCEKVEHFADKTIAALQAENDRLKAKNEELKQIAEHQQDVSMKRYFEIKRLKEDRSRCGMDKHDAAELAYKNGQKQGVKEFAERLKKGLPTWLHPYIDLVEKEMAGEE